MVPDNPGFFVVDFTMIDRQKSTYKCKARKFHLFFFDHPSVYLLLLTLHSHTFFVLLLPRIDGNDAGRKPWIWKTNMVKVKISQIPAHLHFFLVRPPTHPSLPLPPPGLYLPPTHSPTPSYPSSWSILTPRPAPVGRKYKLRGWGREGWVSGGQV